MAVPFSVGTAYLQVVPSFLGVERAIKKEAEKLGANFEQSAAAHLHEGLRAGGRDGAQAAVREMDRRGGEAGNRFGGHFATALRRQAQSAARQLPDIEVDADTSDADRRIAELRKDIVALGDEDIDLDTNAAQVLADVALMRQALDQLGRQDPRIQVKVDAAAALAELAAVQVMVDKLDGDDVDVDVDVDAAAALAELAAVQVMVDKLDGDDVDVDVDVDTAGAVGQLTLLQAASNATLGHLGRIIAVASFLGPMLVPAAAAAAAAFTGLAQAAGAAAAGVGVAGLAVSGIPGAVSALADAEEDAAKSAAKTSTSHLAMASALDQVAAAEAGLATTIITNAEQQRAAAARVADAERNLAGQQRQARLEQQALSEARREAKRALVDLELQLESNSLAARQAALNEADARRELDAVLADPQSSEARREQARITYERAALRIRELEVRQRRLAAEQRRSNRAGVKGSRQVVAAHERVRRANERVAAAQRSVAEAARAQASQQRRAAMALAQAHRSVAAAQRAVERATVSAGDQGSAAMFRLEQSMGRLSPAGRQFALFVFGLRDDLLRLRRTAEAGFLPGFQRAMQSLLPYLPQISGFVGEVATELGRLAVAGVQALQSPFWQDFFGFVRETTIPALRGMAEFLGLAATGLAGLVKAFGPLNADLGRGLVNLMERFARWGTQLETSQGFARFVEYVEEAGPQVMRLLGGMLEFLERLLVAAAPVGLILVDAFGNLFDLLNRLPIGVLTVLVGLIVGVSAALLLLSVTTRTYAVLVNAWGTTMRFAAGAKRGLTAAMGLFRPAADSATAATGRLAAAQATLGRATAGARRAGGALLSLLGGPWGIALGAATLAVGGLMAASAEYRHTVDGLRQALMSLGEVYRDLETAGGRATAATADTLRGIVNANPDMQRAVLTLAEMGVTFDDLGAAAARNDFSPIMQRLEEEIERTERRWKDQSNFLLTVWTAESRATFDRLTHLRQVRDAMEETTGAVELQTEALDVVTAATREEAGLQRAMANQVLPASAQARRQLTDTYQTNADRISALTGLVEVFGNAEATAAQKADAMRAALEQQTGAAVDANEAAEAYHSQLLTLSQSVDANGASLALNTQEGLRNRDALEAVATAAREMYLQDIAAGQPMDEVTDRHRERIDALREEARRLGLAAEETDRLIQQYGEVDPRVETVYTTEGFEQVFNELRMLQFIQDALERGLPLAQAQREWRKELAKDEPWGWERSRARGRATGGPIHGPGTATSDDIPIWASDGEFMQPAAAVDFYGMEAMERIRRRELPRWLFAPGFAAGGRITRVPVDVDVGDTKLPTLAQIVARAGGGAGGGLGWERQMEILRAVFPGLALYSGYRPGDITPSGNRSYHADGRAVDLPPRMDVFNWIAAHYPDSRELIFSPAGRRQIWNGRPHLYTGAVVPQHFDHVHWAYDEGGWLPPGLSLAYNGTGNPEPILTNHQWQTMAHLVDGRTAQQQPNVYQFTFRDTTLTPTKLRSIQDRDAALARAGRPA